MNTKILAILPIAIMVMAIGMYAPNNVSAARGGGGSNPSLQQVTGFSCENTTYSPDIYCTWDNNVSGATKYSVKVTVLSYDNSDPVQTFTFDSTTTNITIPFSGLTSTTINGGVGGGVPNGEVDLAVKALNPSTKGYTTQNNPFSAISSVNYGA